MCVSILEANSFHAHIVNCNAAVVGCHCELKSSSRMKASKSRFFVERYLIGLDFRCEPIDVDNSVFEHAGEVSAAITYVQ